MAVEIIDKWKMYIEKKQLVRVMNDKNMVFLYGVPIETNDKITRFLPYTSYRGIHSEDEIYVWVNEGLPRTIDNEVASQIEPISKEYVNSLFDAALQRTKLGEDKRKLEKLDIELRFSELSKVKELKGKVQR